MPIRTRIAAALVAALVVGLMAMAYDRAGATPPAAGSGIGTIRWLLLGLAAGLAVLAATGLRRPPRSGGRR